MTLLIGLAVFILSITAFWFALPQDGQVRPFLRNDTIQAYYTVLLVGGVGLGLLYIVLGIAALL